MTQYRCFRCGDVTERSIDDGVSPPSRRCCSCGESHVIFTYVEMGDILNNIYLAGADLELLEDFDEGGL